MSDYVVDASVVVQFLVTDTFTENVRTLFRSLTKEDKIHVPEFCFLECTNVLWKEVRFRGMLQKDAVILVRTLRAFPLTVVPMESLLERALQIGLQYQLAVYDSAYIAPAERLNYPLVTVDNR